VCDPAGDIRDIRSAFLRGYDKAGASRMTGPRPVLRYLAESTQRRLLLRRAGSVRAGRARQHTACQCRLSMTPRSNGLRCARSRQSPRNG